MRAVLDHLNCKILIPDAPTICVGREHLVAIRDAIVSKGTVRREGISPCKWFTFSWQSQSWLFRTRDCLLEIKEGRKKDFLQEIEKAINKIALESLIEISIDANEYPYVCPTCGRDDMFAISTGGKCKCLNCAAEVRIKSRNNNHPRRWILA